MAAGKSLSTTHPLYANVTRALSGDLVSCQLRSLLGTGGDTSAQPGGIVVTDAVSFASSWTAIQGIARNNNNWFAIDTTALRRYSLTGTLLNTNSTPFAGLPAGMNHCGDGFADDSFLYVAVANYVSASQTSPGKVIAKYNPSDLTLHSYFDLSALPSDFTCSGLCPSPDGSEFWVVSYNSADADTDSTRKIWRVNATTGAYIGQYSLGARVRGCQGIAYRPNANAVYITSWNGTDSYIYAFDATTFELLQRIDPSNINTTEEIEGVICWDNRIYTHKINDGPRLLGENMALPSNLANGDPALFVSAAQLAETGTILMRWRPATLPTLQTVFDNTTDANTWECWTSSAGALSWRVSNATPRCDYAGIVARTEYIIAMTWSRSGANVDMKLGVNGVYRSTATHAWTAIPTGGLWLGGGNAGNSQADAEFKDVIVFNKVLSDSELLDAYTNFNSLYTAGTPATPGNVNADLAMSQRFATQYGQLPNNGLLTDKGRRTLKGAPVP